MTYVITTRRGNGKPSVMNVTLAEDEARSMCRSLAENGMDKVTLHSLSDVGIIEAVAAWSAGGKRARKLTSNGAPKAQRVTTAKETISEDEVPEGVSEAEAQGEGEPQDPADAIELPEDIADEHGTVYSGYCVKCKATREFHTHEVAEMKNGTLMAKGTCPVCHGGINRILPKGERPDPEWSDEEESNKVTVTVEDGQAEVTVEGEQHIEDVAETVEEAAEAAAAAPQFSDEDKAAIKKTSAALNKAAKEALAEKAGPAAKKAQPRKRTNKKAEGQTELPAEVKEMQKVATCPQCGRKQPVQEKAGLTIFMVHSAPGVDRCPGSTTVVN